jgi:hypothetical protein
MVSAKVSAGTASPFSNSSARSIKERDLLLDLMMLARARCRRTFTFVSVSGRTSAVSAAERVNEFETGSVRV